MRVLFLTCATMIAFAANSVLNRAAVGPGYIDPISFATIRLWAGAVTLVVLCLVLRRGFRLFEPGRFAGVAALVVYIYGFSLAYLSLDAGLGALILFGMVQVTMFSGSLATGERPPLQRWLGAALAFGGLAWLLWPTEDANISLMHGAAMSLAGIAWGVYSLAGRKARDPLVATGANFALAAPIGLLVPAVLPLGGATLISTPGVALAIVAGSVTSGLGYALWYTVLPQLAGTMAAIAQLTVPLIAMVGGLLFLSEALTLDFVLASVLVLGGVVISVVRIKS